MSARFEFTTPSGKSFVMYAKDESEAALKATRAGHVVVHGSVRPVGRWNGATCTIVGDPYEVTVEGDVHARPQKKAAPAADTAPKQLNGTGSHLNGAAKGPLP